MNDIERTLNLLREKRRDAARGVEKAKRAGDQVGAKRAQKELERIDGEIRNLL